MIAYFVVVVVAAVDYLVAISLVSTIMFIHLLFVIVHSVCSISVIAIDMFYLLGLEYYTATTTCHCAILIRLIVANIIHSVSSIFITFYIFNLDAIVAMMLSIKLIVFC